MAESKIDQARKLADETQKKAKKRKSEEETSLIPSRRGTSKSYVISKGDHEYELGLRFPGAEVAMNIIDDCRNFNGSGFRSADIINEAIDENVIETPKALIENRMTFFENHHGTGEVAVNIATFLAEKLS